MIPLIEQDVLGAITSRDWDALEVLALRARNLVRDREMDIRGVGGYPPPASISNKDESDVILLTGAAGFIGSSVTGSLLEQGHHVIGVDDFNDHYDVACKYSNVVSWLGNPKYEIYHLDIRDIDALRCLFHRYRIRQILHLAARPGVRASLQDPQLYVQTNVLGTQNLLEMAREFSVENFVYASSSSVYGGSEIFPLSEKQNVDHPISPYAATKKANEVQASTYAKLFGIPVTGLRFFTVYGPKGRPDMSIRMFMEKLDRGEPIPMFGDGSFERDFTYVEDIVDGIVKSLRTARGKKGWDEVFNLGEFRTTTVRRMILLMVQSLGHWEASKSVEEMTEEDVQAEVEKLVAAGIVARLPVPLGDVPKTYADISKAREMLGYDPKTPLAAGIRKTARWHLEQKRFREDSLRQKFHESIRAYWQMRHRASLDSLGRPKDPVYTEPDLHSLISHIDHFERYAEQADSEGERLLAVMLIAWAWEVIGWIAAYLPRQDEARTAGLGRLSVHRKRMQIIQMTRDSGYSPLRGERLKELMRLAREVIALTGERERAIVVAAAGYGSRVAKELGGLNKKHSLFLGDEMLLLSLRNVAAFARRIVVVANEHNVTEIQERLDQSEINQDNGFQIEYVIQENRFGDGEAHLTAFQVLKDFKGVVLFVFADAPTKTPETIERMMILKEALGALAPLVIPCEDDMKPYSPILLAGVGQDRGRVLWNWQKADERDFPDAADARNSYGLRNVGLFAAETSVFPFMQAFRDTVFSNYPRFKKWQQAMAEWEAKGKPKDHKPKEPEYGFADLMKMMPKLGFEVAAPNLATPNDRLNVNSLDDAEKVKSVLLERNPLSRVEIEKRPEHSEVYVKFVDLDSSGEPIQYGSTLSLRHCARLRFPQGTPLDNPKIEKQIQQHIETVSQRISGELGIKIIS